jgi:hypothetical protein
LSKERVRERFNGRLARYAGSGCGAAEFRLTTPAARDARGDLSLDKERSGRASRAGSCEALLDKKRLGRAPRAEVRKTLLDNETGMDGVSARVWN